MAHDSLGRVYIDNIYAPSEGMGNYGQHGKIVNRGHLVYKPEDYRNQVKRWIPAEFRWIVPVFPGERLVQVQHGKENATPFNTKYHDISRLWETIEVVQKYKEALHRRGVQLRNS